MNLYNISLNNLRRRKTKMTFLVLGLTIAVATVVTLVTVSRAMNIEIANKLDEFGANIVIVPKREGLSLSYGGMTVSGISVSGDKLSTEDASAIRTIKNSGNVKIIAPKLLNAAVISGRGVLVVGVQFPQELQLKKWWKISGNIPSTRQAIIGSEVKEKLHLDINETFGIQGKEFKVAGILGQTGSQDDGIIFIDLSEAQQIFRKPRELSLIEIAALCYDCPIEEIVRQTSDKLPGARVTAIRQAIESKMDAMHRFEHFSFGMSIVVLLVAGMIVATTMSGSVNERTREIGVFRAIGFRQTHVMKVILTEALLTSCLAGAVGYLLGLIAAHFVSPLLITGGTSGGLSVDIAFFLSALALAMLIGLLSSLYPAFKASRLDPTVALKAL